MENEQIKMFNRISGQKYANYDYSEIPFYSH